METSLTCCKPINTLTDPNVKLLPNHREPYPNPGRYRRPTRKSPWDSHWNAIVRILKYIKESPSKEYVFSYRGHTEIIGYSDADWAGDASDRRSKLGYCIFIGGNLISWKNKMQTTDV